MQLPTRQSKRFWYVRFCRAREASSLTYAHFELFNVSEMITADCELGVALFLPSRPLNTCPLFRAGKIWFINRHRDKHASCQMCPLFLGGSTSLTFPYTILPSGNASPGMSELLNHVRVRLGLFSLKLMR